MNYFSKEKISLWIIVILVILNLFTLSTIWFKEYRFPFRSIPEESRHRRHGLKILQEELGLTAEQIEEFDTIRQRHFEKMRPLQKEIKSLRREVIDELCKTEPDTDRVRTLILKIGEREIERERYIFKHFMEMKSACAPDQKNKFEILLRELMNRPHGTPGPGQRRQEFGYGQGGGLIHFFDESDFFPLGNTYMK